ncbi:hypothetical protein SRHO_G00098080 [Serrasalmus rhombeus]
MFLSVSGGQRLDWSGEIIPQLFTVHLEVSLSGLWKTATHKTRKPWGQIEKKEERKGDKVSWRCPCLT